RHRSRQAAARHPRSGSQRFLGDLEKAIKSGRALMPGDLNRANGKCSAFDASTETRDPGLQHMALLGIYSLERGARNRLQNQTQLIRFQRHCKGGYAAALRADK